MHDIADVQAGQVHDDLLGDFAGQHVQFDFGAHHGQCAAALQAGGCRVVFEFDMDEQVDPGGAAQTHQVHMGRHVLDDIALNAAANDAHVILAFDLQVEQRRQETARLQLLQQVIEVEVQREGINAASVNHARDLAITTRLTSGPLACPRPDLGDEIWDLFCHIGSPKFWFHQARPSKGGCAPSRLLAGKGGEGKGLVGVWLRFRTLRRR